MIGVAAVAFAATLTSCSKAGDLYDEGKVEEQKIASVTEKYDDAFIKAFGQPAANQDWGFASRKLPASFGAGTRNAQPNGNQWGNNSGMYLDYPTPDPITDDELSAVLTVFNQKGDESYTALVDWSNFFVQHVYTGEAHYKDGNGADVLGSVKMNRLACTTNKNQTGWWPLKFEDLGYYTEDIVNNANAGRASGYENNGCMLMMGSSTKDWSYESSQSSSMRFHYFRMERINGNYYVGFDFSAEGQNKNEQVKRDLIYNDWIVKIVPGKGEIVPPEPRRYAVRVICEDLMANASSDFDFNDVVFDVTYVENVNKTNIVIKAAGGTIPLYIQGNEVHKLFQDAYPDAGIILPGDGVKGTMINTHASGGVEVGDVILTLNGIIAPKDIEITINNGGTSIPLKAEVGQPAAKIAVDPSFNWLNERDNITQVCPDFPTFVKNGNINWY